MAKVIDKLRVQGNPAPRNLASYSAPASRGSCKLWAGGREEISPDQQTAHFVLNHAHLQPANRDSLSGRIVSPAARRLQHMQRVQQTNQGLCSMDIRRPDLPGKQFMLRGKPASAEVALLNRQRAILAQETTSALSGRFGTGSMRASSKTVNRPEKALSEPPNGLIGERRAEVRGGKSLGNETALSQPALRVHPSTLTSYFVLANANTPHHAATHSAPPQHLPHHPKRQSAPGTAVTANRRYHNATTAPPINNFQLTGHQVFTPRSNTENGMASRDYPNHVTSPKGSQGATRDYWMTLFKDRKSPGLKDNSADLAEVDHEMLRECLHVQQASNRTGHGDSGDAVKLKHKTQYVRSDLQHSTRMETKVNYNNPYRQTQTRERRMLPESDRRYIFDSVVSYIHFHKIYPQEKDSNSTGNHVKGAVLGGFGMNAPKIPRLAGFPKHCTDTILLRMFEMNRPGAIYGVGLGHQVAGAPSIRSSVSNKYSEMARHKDLDEFLTARSPPTSLHHQHNQQPSHRSAVEIPSPPEEEVEEEPDSHEGEAAVEGGVREGAGVEADTAEEKLEKLEGGKAEGEEEEGESTLWTMTTTGRDFPDDNADDDEASVWNNTTLQATTADGGADE